MTEPRIPEERLYKIARRKLMALGIQTWFSEDQKQLKGEIVVNPPMELLTSDGTPIKKARFVVVGHDRMRFFKPESLVVLTLTLQPGCAARSASWMARGWRAVRLFSDLP